MGKCRSTNILYQNTCQLCKTEGRSTIYIGESGRTNHERQKEHLNDWRTADKGSHMHLHMQEHHPEVPLPVYTKGRIKKDLRDKEVDARWKIEPDVFQTKIVGRATSALERQVWECVLIR